MSSADAAPRPATSRRGQLKRLENRFGFLLAIPALIAFCVVVVNFLVDMAYMALDPRIKYAD